jgi:hypothetical protein
VTLVRAALQVQNQDPFASPQFAHELLRRDPRESEFAQESIRANKPEDDEDANPYNSCEDRQRSNLCRVAGDAIQLITEGTAQSRVGRRSKNRASGIEDQKPRPVGSGDSCHGSGDSIQSYDELGNQENSRSVAIESHAHLAYARSWISRGSADV